MDRQTHRQTDTHRRTYKHIDGQTDRHTGRQTHTVRAAAGMPAKNML